MEYGHFLQGVVATVSMDIFMDCGNFLPVVVTTVSVDTFFRLWTFCAGHGYYGKRGHFLWSVNIFCCVWSLE